MKILGIIPSRYASTRFPGKPLAMIGDQTMLQRVYLQAKKSAVLDHVVIATDDPRLEAHAHEFGAAVCMTGTHHPSGTDRCHEALTLQSTHYDYIINIQGDEPFIQPEQIDLLGSLLNGQTQLATLVKQIMDYEQLNSPNIVKVLLNKNQQAIYFSRSVVPHIRNAERNRWLDQFTFYKHIGMYAYRADILREITTLSPSSLEKAESLEQLRWIENGYPIQVAVTGFETIGIDVPQDLEKAQAYLRTAN